MSSATNLIDPQVSTKETTSSSSSSGLHKLSSGQGAMLYGILAEITKVRLELMSLYKEITEKELSAQNAAVLAASASRVQAGEAKQKSIRCQAGTSFATGGMAGVTVVGAWRGNSGNHEEARAHEVVIKDHNDMLGHFKDASNHTAGRYTSSIPENDLQAGTRKSTAERQEQIANGAWDREKGSAYARASDGEKAHFVEQDKTAIHRLKHENPAGFDEAKKSLIEKLKELRTEANAIQNKIDGLKHKLDVAEKIAVGLTNGTIGVAGQATAAQDEAQKEANASISQAVTQSASAVIEAAKQESSKCLELILALNNAIAQAARASAGAA